MMKQNKLTPEKAQELTRDLLEIVTQKSSQSYSLLEVIIDQYLYSLNDKEVDELEDIIVNEFGYD
tara:strand:- start:136 stop:330 length:195 start_codon:yes stop_codon:yes gene_type:complete